MAEYSGQQVCGQIRKFLLNSPVALLHCLFWWPLVSHEQTSESTERERKRNETVSGWVMVNRNSAHAGKA